MLRNELEPLHVTILDRYLVTELSGPALFGGAAFTLIFVATQISRDRAARLAAERAAARRRSNTSCGRCRRICCSSSRWRCCSARCSRCGGSPARARSRRSKRAASRSTRMFVPLAVLVAGRLAGFARRCKRPWCRLANDRAAYLRESVIEHLSPAASNLSAVTHLPGGGQAGHHRGRPRRGDADAAQRDRPAIRCASKTSER